MPAGSLLKCSVTRGLRPMLAIFLDPGWLNTTISSPSGRNQTGVGTGVPDLSTVVNQTTRSSSRWRNALGESSTGVSYPAVDGQRRPAGDRWNVGGGGMRSGERAGLHRHRDLV